MFRFKLEELKNGFIQKGNIRTNCYLCLCSRVPFKKEIFGPIAAYVYVLEFQKRGLPHVHFLIILKSGLKILSPEAFNRIVNAELSVESENPHLFSIVVKQMMHGPCGILNPKNVCTKKNGECKTTILKSYVQ